MKDEYDEDNFDDLDDLDDPADEPHPGEVDTKKPYHEMTNDELTDEYTYLADLVKDFGGGNQLKQSLLSHLLYVKALLEERYLLH